MAKDPAVLFYTSDFLSGTMTMTDEHIGMYIKLLCLQHQKGKLSEKDMLYICKSYVEDVYLKFTKEDDGFYYNIRMKDEASKRKAYSESRRKNVSNRYKKGCKKSSTKNPPSTYVEHMENENENENKDIYINEFESLWKNYPKKLGRNSSLKTYLALCRKDKNAFKKLKKSILNYKALIRKDNIEEKYIKQGSTFFNNWEDYYNQESEADNGGVELRETIKRR